ncbi:TPA: hypothetical protein RUW97_002806 [Aeromonas dhakensis]|uniref:hypothetical protein n=1 Tax=Aeromonas dhakensis TaxID=196024 RepID=UPI000FC0838C|nr:hypothetical protein [Aeromonas dhakensis]
MSINLGDTGHFDAGMRSRDPMVCPFKTNNSGWSIEHNNLIQLGKQHQPDAGLEGILATFLALIVMAEMVNIYLTFTGN